MAVTALVCKWIRIHWQAPTGCGVVAAGTMTQVSSARRIATAVLRRNISVEALAESVLEEMKWFDLRRAIYTRLLRIIRAGGTGLVMEFRAWRAAVPDLTRAMLNAGQDSEVRHQHQLEALVDSWRADGTAA